MKSGKAILGLALAGLASAASAQAPHRILLTGDTVLGMGAVTRVDTATINNHGDWLSLIDTDFPDAQTDGALMISGFVTLREGLTYAPGTSMDEWNNLSFNDKGDIAMVIKVKPGAADALFWNLKLLATRGTPFVVPTFSGVWDTVDTISLTDNNQLFAIGKLAQGTTKLGSLVRLDLDAHGNILQQTLILQKGQTLPAPINTTIQDLKASGNQFAANIKGDWMAIASITGGRNMILRNGVVLAREASMSPTGTLWRSMASSRVAMNDRGDWFLSGSVEPPGGTDFIYVVNGELFARSGDTIAGIPDLGVSSGATVTLTNTGDLFWQAFSKTGGTPTDQTWIRNRDKIIKVNETEVDGKLVTSLSADDKSGGASSNGRFFAAVVAVEGRDTLVIADFGLVLPFPGCNGNPGKLSLVSGNAVTGGQIQLGMDKGSAPGDLVKIVFSSRPAIANSDCGIMTQNGEVLIGTSRLGAFQLPPWTGEGPSTMTFHIPNRVSLVNAVAYAQGQFRKPGSHQLRLTNGLRIEVGAP